MSHLDPAAWIAFTALVFAILAQAVVGAWQMGRLHERQAGHGDRLEDLETKGADRDKAAAAADVVLADIGATLRAMGREIGDIKTALSGRH